MNILRPNRLRRFGPLLTFSGKRFQTSVHRRELLKIVSEWQNGRLTALLEPLRFADISTTYDYGEK